jgi:hypothetical protein
MKLRSKAGKGKKKKMLMQTKCRTKAMNVRKQRARD